MHDSQEEDLLLTRALLRLVLGAVAVAWRGGPVPEADAEAFRAWLDRAALPAPMATEAAAAAASGVHALPAPEGQSPEQLRRFALRLRLLAIRLGEGREEIVDRLVGPADEAARRLRERATPLDLAGALDEVLSPPPLLRTVLNATRPAEARRRTVGRLNPGRYRHSLDRGASAAVSRAFPFEDLARKLSELVPERIWALLNTSSNLRVGPQQLPELYAIYQGCVKRLGVHPEPPLYVSNIGLNAFTGGVEEPFIVLGDVLVGVCSRAELEFVIGHELGHIVFDHLLMNLMARLALIPGALLRLMPVVGPILLKGLDLALFEWARKAELSCDRAGLLVSQDPQAAWRLYMRLAGAPAGQIAELRPEVFLEQYKELEGKWEDLLSSIFYVLSTAERSHPWTVVRAHELSQWIDDGQYDALLSECPFEADESGPLEEALGRFTAGAALDLNAELLALAERGRAGGLPAFAAMALQRLAEAGAQAPPSVVFLGERYRGHLELTGALAPYAEGLRLVQTPFLGEDEERFASESMPELLCASAVVACLSAAQLLGETERERLGLLLRLVRCPVALVVGRMDVIESEEDDRDVRRRAERFAGPLGAAVLYVMPVQQPHEELVAWMRRACERGAGDAAWRERVASALAAVEVLCEEEAGAELAIDAMRAELHLVQARALLEAHGALRAQFARVRAEAPGWLGAMGTEERRHEGVDRLMREVGEAADAAGRAYLANLEQGLAGARELEGAGAALRQELGDLPGAAILEGAPRLNLPKRGESSPSMIAAALGTLAVGALLVPGAPVWLAATGLGLGVASYFAGSEVRAERDRVLGEGHKEGVEAWLSSTEAAMAARLDEVGARCLEAMEARLDGQAGPPGGGGELRGLIARIRKTHFGESA